MTVGNKEFLSYLLVLGLNDFVVNGGYLSFFSNLYLSCSRSLSSKESESPCQWKLCFKLYCLLDADGISLDSIEYLFLFEQVRVTW